MLRSTRDRTHLDPDLFPRCLALEDAAPKVLGVEILVSDIWRSRQTQEAIWAVGRDLVSGEWRLAGTGVVTWARPGTSPHEVMRRVPGLQVADGMSLPRCWSGTRTGEILIPSSMAFDVAFDLKIGPGQEITWEGPWDELGTLAESLGLCWGGRWESFRDRTHFYLPDWKDRAAERGWRVVL